MSSDFKQFVRGIRLRDNDDTGLGDISGSLTATDNGALYVYQNRIKAFLSAAEIEVVTVSQSQTLTNKTIDADNNTISELETDNFKAGVISTDISGVNTDTEIPTALAVANALDGQNEASEINYDNSTSGLAATNVQDAIDEVDGNLDTHVGASSGVHGVTGNVVGDTDTQTLTNKTINADNNTVSELETDNFKTGVITTTVSGASTNTEIPTALAVQTALEAQDSAAEITYDNSTSGLTATDVQAAIDEVEGRVDTAEGTLSSHVGASSGVHGITGSVVGTTDVQDLSNKTITDTLTLEEQGSTPATPATGDVKFYAKDDSKLYFLNDQGVEQEVGSGAGAGDPSIYGVLNAEDQDVTGFTNFTTGSSAPVINGDFQYEASTFPASTAQVDIPTRAVVKSSNACLFEYRSGGGTGTAEVLDQANNVLGTTDLPLTTSDSSKATVTFTPLSTSTSVYLRISVDSGLTSVAVDDIVFTDDVIRTASFDVTSEWTAFDQAITASGGNPAKSGTTQQDEGYWRRVGTNMEIRWSYRHFVAGTAGAAEYQFTIPDGQSIDTSQFNNTSANIQNCVGTASASDGTRAGVGTMNVFDSTSLRMVIGNEIDSFVSVSNTHYSLGGGVCLLSYTASVPIEGWASKETNVVATTDVVAPVRYTRSTTTSLPSPGPAIFDFNVEDYDDNNLVTTGGSWAYTVPAAGKYRITSAIEFDAVAPGNLAFDSQVFVNGVSQATYGRNPAFSSGAAVSGITSEGSTVLELAKGDSVDIRFSQAAGGPLTGNSNGNSYINIEKIDDNINLASTPFETPVVAVARNASQAITGSDAVNRVNFSTVDFDTTNSITTGGSWVFTTPSSGFYEISCQVSINAIANGTRTILQIFANNVRVFQTSVNNDAGADRNALNQGNITVELNEGETIYAQVLADDAAPGTTAGDTAQNYISIKKIANLLS